MSRLQLTVPWTTVKMSTGFSTWKMRRNAARSLPSTVPQTTGQMSTSRGLQSAVPWTTARTSTRSTEQQRLSEATACLPMWYSYEDEHPVHLLYQRVTALREEYRLANNASSPSQPDNNASSSSFPSKVPISTCRPCVQPSTRALHQNINRIAYFVRC